MIVSPYGSWSSPITSDLIAAEAIRLDQVALDGDAVFWTESQPQKQGRSFLYRSVGGGEPVPVTPDDESNRFNVRTRAHEYGGGAFAADGGTVVFSNFADQRLYRQDAGGAPHPITPLAASGPADALRYADGAFDRRRGRIICVREDHTGGGEAINALVGVDLGGRARSASARLGQRLLCLAAPEPGRRASGLADLESSEHAVGRDRALGRRYSGRRRDRKRAAGRGRARRIDRSSRNGREPAISRIRLRPERLVEPLSLSAGGAIEPLASMEAEFARPQWVFGMSSYAFESDERLICSFVKNGVWTLARLDLRSGRLDPISDRVYRHIPGPRERWAGSVPRRDPVGSAGAGRTRSRRRDKPDHPALVRRSGQRPPPISRGPSRSRSRPKRGRDRPCASITRRSTPPSPPRPARSRRALVLSHGGPTASASSTLTLGVQYWTSRGFARARRELRRQHRLRSRLSRSARTAMGRRGRRRTASTRAQFLVESRDWSTPTALAIAAAAPAATRRWLRAEPFGDVFARRRELLRRQRPGSAGPRHPQVRDRAISTG